MFIRDRIRSLRRVRARDLLPNPRNWRTHPPAQQNALRALLAEVGYAGALVARELPGGRLELIDGHLRAETTPDQLVPVLVLDVSEQEAAKLLTFFDPISTLAGRDEDRLAALVAEVQTDSPALTALLKRLADSPPPTSQALADPGAHEPTYQLVVQCDDEAEQKALFTRLAAEGFSCRVLTM
jgi:hypothetical protein